MAALRLAQARFTGATPERRAGMVGVGLCFRPERTRLQVDRIEDFAPLGPELTVPTVGGLGKVLRVLRAARVAAPADPLELVGREQRAVALLDRAIGATVRLSLRPRFRLGFEVWTEGGVERVEDVAEILEYEDAYFVRRRRGAFPLRFERGAVVRQRVERERWFEVVGIERA